MKKINVRDLVNIAIFSVVYILSFYIPGMLGFFGPPFMFVGWIIGIVLGGIVLMLLMARVPKVGTLSVVGLITGLIMTPGHTALVLVACPLFGFVADLIMSNCGKNDALQATRAILAYAVFKLWIVVPLIPIIFNADAYYKTITATMGQEYSDSMRSLFTPTIIGIWAVVIFIVALSSGWLGARTARKHFHRAGLTR